MEIITQLQILGSVAIATVLGGVIGIEREFADKPAGFRTHMLVAGASALLMEIGDVVLAQLGGLGSPDAARLDPTRIMQAIVTGISFLGAGTIIRRRQEEGVEGLTTAASILLSAAVGIAVALDQLVLGAGTTLLAIFILVGMKFIERAIERTRDSGENT